MYVWSKLLFLENGQHHTYTVYRWVACTLFAVKVHFLNKKRDFSLPKISKITLLVHFEKE
jgi:hypothetical protein